MLTDYLYILADTINILAYINRCLIKSYSKNSQGSREESRQSIGTRGRIGLTGTESIPGEEFNGAGLLVRVIHEPDDVLDSSLAVLTGDLLEHGANAGVGADHGPLQELGEESLSNQRPGSGQLSLTVCWIRSGGAERCYQDGDLLGKTLLAGQTSDQLINRGHAFITGWFCLCQHGQTEEGSQELHDVRVGEVGYFPM